MKYYQKPVGFAPWQPSTWPEPPIEWTPELADLLEAIFTETMLNELDNVIDDVLAHHGSLLHRGHVIALSLLCAVDTLSSYGYVRAGAATCAACGRQDKTGPRFKRFIEEHFPAEYREFAQELYTLYRNSTVHSWHLFKVSILPGEDPIERDNGTIRFGLLSFFAAMKVAANDFFAKLRSEPTLQESALKRYSQLRASAVA